MKRIEKIKNKIKVKLKAIIKNVNYHNFKVLNLTDLT